MGFQRLIVLTAFLMFIQDYEVSAQYATVMECLPQPTATIARPIVQSAGQFLLPAIIQPIVPGYDSYAPEPAACFPNYGNSPAPLGGYPPIILKDNDDTWRNLLYFLILTMGNKRDSSFNMPPSNGGCPSCNSSGKCRCCCDCSNCNTNVVKESETSSPIYIPVPIAIPVYTGPDGCRYIDGFCDDIIIQESCGQPCNCNSCRGKDANEINLIIKTDY